MIETNTTGAAVKPTVPMHGGHAGAVTTSKPSMGAGTRFFGDMGRRYTVNTVKGIRDVAVGTVKGNKSGLQSNALFDPNSVLGRTLGSMGPEGTMMNYTAGNLINNNAFADATAPLDFVGADAAAVDAFRVGKALVHPTVKFIADHPVAIKAAGVGVASAILGIHANASQASYGPAGETGNKAGGPTAQWNKIQQFFPNGGIKNASPTEIIKVLSSTDKKGEPIGKYFVGKTSRPGSYDDNYSVRAAKRIAFNSQSDAVKEPFKGRTPQDAWWKTQPIETQNQYKQRYKAPTTSDLIQFMIDSVKKYTDPKTGDWVPGGKEAFFSKHDLGHDTKIGETATFDTPLLGWLPTALNRAEGALTTGVKIAEKTPK